MALDPHDASSADSGLGFTGLTAFGPVGGRMAEEARLSPGTMLDDVTIVRFIAEGGMGCVYEGRQGVPARTVAVKVLRPGSLSPSAAKRFLNEAHVLGRLSHPGIAQIHAVGMHRTADGVLPCFVMEYVDGGTPITADADKRGLAIRDRVRLFREVCQAVAHGHQRGVIHRDLKPGNILVDAGGHPKVIDFGVARCTDVDAGLTTMHTAVGQLVGTPHYMSPEQFDGAGDDVDVRADVYSLGVVLHQLLVGSLPYDVLGKPVHGVASVVREAEPRRLGLVDRRLRGDLETVVATCLEKDPDRRYSSAAELEADLGRWLAGDPIAAARPGLADSLMRLARRHRVATTAACAVTAAVLAGTAGVAIFAVRADRARQQSLEFAREATAGREAARRERDRADAEAAQAKRLLTVANLRSIQFALAEGNRQAARRLLADTAGLVPGDAPLEFRCLATEVDDATDVIATEGPVTAVRFSPDGAAVGIRARAGWAAPFGLKRLGIEKHQRLTDDVEITKVFEIDSGRRRAARSDDEWPAAWRASGSRPEPGRGPIEWLATTEDGTRALAYGAGGTPEVVDAATGRRMATLEGAAGRQLAGSFSPDGSRIVTLDRLRRLTLWDAADGRVVANLVAERMRDGVFEFSGDGSRLVLTRLDERATPQAEVAVIHDTHGGDAVASIRLPRTIRSRDTQTRLNHDGTMLATATRDGHIYLWDTTTGASLAQLAAHRGAIESLAFARDGRRLAAGADDGRIVVWSVEQKTVLREFIGHDEAVTSLAFHPHDDQLASGSLDGTVRLWRTSGPMRLSELPIASVATRAAFSPDGQFVAIGCQEAGRVEIWRVATAERLALLHGGPGQTTAVGWSPDGRLLAAGFHPPDGGGEACVWRLDHPVAIALLARIPCDIIGLIFTPDGGRVVTTARNGIVAAWDASSGTRLWTSPTRNPRWEDCLEAVLVRGGAAVAHGHSNLRDSVTGDTLTVVRNLGCTTSLAVSPCGKLLASGMAMGTAYLTDLTTLTGALTDAVDGTPPRVRLVGHEDAVTSLAFSPDGRKVATGSLDGTARIWSCDDATTTQEAVFSGNGGGVEKVAFSPDGRRLLTASADGEVRLWDPVVGRILCTLPAPSVTRVAAISPDGRVVLAGTAQGGLRLWGLSNAEITAARRLADGPLVGRPGDRALPLRLLESREKGGQVGEILAAEAEGPKVR